MEEIIKKAIEGGYTVYGKPLRWSEKTKSWWYYWMSEDEEGNPIELENPACLDHPHGMYPMILDPLFWQALGKACGWYVDRQVVYTIPNEQTRQQAEIYVEDNLGVPLKSTQDKVIFSPYKGEDKTWKEHALRFHEINLTQGWDSAIKYLEELVK